LFCVGAAPVILLFSVVLFCGCVSKSKAQTQAQIQAQAAYLAGQNAALRQQQAQAPGVTVVGPVQNPDVPWVEGLTLAQAIATANYLDSREPRQIVITRNGESAIVDPKILLSGAVVPLEAGDVIELRP